jgi:hypothetical protein
MLKEMKGLSLRMGDNPFLSKKKPPSNWGGLLY